MTYNVFSGTLNPAQSINLTIPVSCTLCLEKMEPLYFVSNYAK